MGAFGPSLVDISVAVWKAARTEGIYGRVWVAVYCTCSHAGVGGVFLLRAINHVVCGCSGASGQNRASVFVDDAPIFLLSRGFSLCVCVFVCLVLLQGVTHTHTHTSKNIILV